MLHPVSLTFWMVVLILLLPWLLPERELKQPSDEALREMARSGGMLPTPLSYEGLLAVVDTPENPLTPAKIALGKQLFFDPILSWDRTLNCASCHDLGAGGDDNRATAIGYHGRENPFHLNSPTVLNSALATAQFWDGRVKTVEDQAGGPIQAPFEMNMTPAKVEQRLNQHPTYPKAFAKVFPNEGNITFWQVRQVIGAYERTLLTHGAYDRFLEGDNNALSPQAKRGMMLFLSRGCKGCHSGMSVGGGSLQQFPLRRFWEEYLGAVLDPKFALKRSPFPFENVGGFLGADNRLKFRVPILRNITQTAPYFHNGAIDKLEEAVRIMSKYQLGKEFTPQEIDAVVAFLKSLEGELVEY